MSEYEHGSEELTEGQTRYYTPTTEEVRRRYMFGVWEETQDTSGDTNVEFYRWLAEVKAQVWDEAYTEGYRHGTCDVEPSDNPYWKVTDASNSD